jgi:hypothetical protein
MHSKSCNQPAKYMILCVLCARLPLRPADKPFHFEAFSTPDWTKRWHVTTLENYTGEWRLYEAPFPQNYRDEKMIFATNESAFYGLSTSSTGRSGCTT